MKILVTGAGGFVGRHLVRHLTEAGDVDHRIHHRQIVRTDIGRRIARCHGRDHELGNPHRQRPHRLGDEGGVAGSAESEHRPDVVPTAQERRERRRHRGDGRPAVVEPEHGPRAIRMVSGNRRGVDIRATPIQEESNPLLMLLWSFGPALLIIGLWAMARARPALSAEQRVDLAGEDPFQHGVPDQHGAPA